MEKNNLQIAYKDNKGKLYKYTSKLDLSNFDDKLMDKYLTYLLSVAKLTKNYTEPLIKQNDEDDDEFNVAKKLKD